MGRRSVMFEAQPIPGGMLALGIPEYRLPKDTLNKEIAFILSHGVELHTSTPVADASELIKQGFKAVFVATGAQKGKTIDIEGSDLEGVVDAIGFLRDRALGRGSTRQTSRRARRRQRGHRCREIGDPVGRT
jgi:NADPH-dependent glutamate synthase beta subunit-like oxidoreductase